jgi:peptidylprolyl isomerase
MFLLGCALVIIAMVSVSPRQVVRGGDTVTVNYTITLEDGTVYDSTSGREPLKVTLGKGVLLPNFEKQLIGMQIGKSRKFTLSPEKAYGQPRPDLVGTVARDWLPENIEPQVGKQLQTELKDGTPVLAVITAFDDATITLDANHPLAGQTLTFSVELMAIGNQTTSTSANQTPRYLLIIALGALLIGAAYVFTNIRKQQALVPLKRGARAMYKKHPRVHYR